MGESLKYHFSHRLTHVPPSFLGELFRVSSKPGIISFAGGLPDASLFDLEGIRKSAMEVLTEEGECALQYTSTEGYLPLREYIASRYYSRLGLCASPEDIQIVNGSQQCLDLIGKVLINPDDPVLIERPGYLGAIEAFSFYEPDILPVYPSADQWSGPDPDIFCKMVQEYSPALFYGIPNSQNPSGMSWATDLRKEIAETLDGTGTLMYEDDAFGELFFDGRPRHPVKRWISDQTIMTGSFSKTISPGLRCGWIWAPNPVIEVFNRAKQAADLHSNLLSQMVLTQYLNSSDPDVRIKANARIYGERCRIMADCIDDQFPVGTKRSNPEGGMFMMIQLPAGVLSMEVFEEGVRQGVAVMPGSPFYVDGGGTDSIRLNFSSSHEDQIVEGMSRLCHVIQTLCS
jgi:2-aminoadipate transaminase